jgi:hypothetical protein
MVKDLRAYENGAFAFNVLQNLERFGRRRGSLNKCRCLAKDLLSRQIGHYKEVRCFRQL